MGRSKWKGPHIDVKNLLTISRNAKITPKLNSLKFKVYNGKDYKEINITKDMIDHKIGEFFQTRKKFSFKKKNK